MGLGLVYIIFKHGTRAGSKGKDRVVSSSSKGALVAVPGRISLLGELGGDRINFSLSSG
jgi:hypothetical protein